MNNFKNIFIGFFILVIISCNAVYTSQPIGEKPVKLQVDSWEGTWLHKDGFLVTKVIDSEKGLLEVGWINENDKGLELETFEIYIRETGNRMFVNIKTKDDSKKDKYVLGKIKKNGHQVIGWELDIAEFKRLISSGQIPGEVDKQGNVHLNELKPEHMNIFTSGDEAMLYNSKNPFAIIRVSR